MAGAIGAVPLLVQPRELRFRLLQRALEKQRALYQEVGSIRLLRDGPANHRLGLGILGADPRLRELGEERLQQLSLLGGHESHSRGELLEHRLKSITG